ncbi:PmbA/TldA family metallopeptidase, partial [Cloacibacillus evryensis]
MIKFLPHDEVEALAAHALDLAAKSGAWGADLLYSEGSGSGLTLKDGETEECASGSSAGIGIRTIMSDGRQGIAYGSRLDKASVDSLVEWSLHNALASEPEEGITLYEGPLVRCRELDAEDRRIREITAADRMKYCLEMTREARSLDSRIVSVRSAS